MKGHEKALRYHPLAFRGHGESEFAACSLIHMLFFGCPGTIFKNNQLLPISFLSKPLGLVYFQKVPTSIAFKTKKFAF